MIHRNPFHGTTRRLVLSMDLGTTFSGMSYAILDPSQVPEIKSVNRCVFISILLSPDCLHRRNRYPGQEASDAKIPTVIWYDSNGRVLACGAEEPPEPPLEDDSEWQDRTDDEWEDLPKTFKVEWYFSWLLTLIVIKRPDVLGSSFCPARKASLRIPQYPQ